jgi:septum site-determining protein MinC
LTSANAVRSRQTIRFRGRSLVAFVLAPTLPVADWLDELDRWSKTSPDFFVGRPTILDLTGLSLPTPEIAKLVTVLAERGIRVLGLDGVEADQLDPSLPPLLKGGRPTSELPGADGSGAGPADASIAGFQRNEQTSLLIDTPIRSGQSVVFPYGDLTVLGAVSSGAEIMAGGSIHIYGTLRGRAMAGAMGNNSKARVFCSRNEAELIAIDGYYTTADDMAPELRGRAVQCWLGDYKLRITALD